MQIGKRIRDVRQKAGWTQAEAARRAGMSQAQWARYEADGRSPTVGTLARIARAVNVSIGELLGE